MFIRALAAIVSGATFSVFALAGAVQVAEKTGAK
jgi:hypothetical protein